MKQQLALNNAVTALQAKLSTFLEHANKLHNSKFLTTESVENKLYAYKQEVLQMEQTVTQLLCEAEGHAVFCT